MKNNLFPIAKEGWKYIAYSIASFIVFAILDLEFFELLSFVIVLLFIAVFRNPERDLPTFEENSVLCPVDGKVIAIDELSDSEYAYKVTINSAYKDVGILRSPLSSQVTDIKKVHGTRLSMEDSLSSKINENVSIIFQDTNENNIKVTHSLKQSFVPISLDITISKNLLQSSRYGLMIDGITEIYLPHNFRLSLIMGEETTASESLVGYFS